MNQSASDVCNVEMEGKFEVESLCNGDSKTKGVVGMGVAESTGSRSNQKPSEA